MQRLKISNFLDVVRYYCTTNQLPTVKANVQRYSSCHKRSSNLLQRDHLETLRTEVFKSRSELTPKEWEETRQTLINSYRHITAGNVDAVILGVCNEPQQLPLAKNYIKCLHQTGKEANAATLGRLLRVYNAAYHARGGHSESLTKKEQKEILEIYARLRKTYDVLDATTCENVIHGLVATEQWRDAKEIIEMNKISAVPSLGVYSELIIKAFSMNDMQLGWHLLTELVEHGKTPKCEIFIAYLETISKQPGEFLKHFEELLLFLGKHEIIVSVKVVHEIQSLSKSLKLNAVTTNLSRIGKCSNCGNYMQNVSINDEEFKKLSDSFLNKVLIRNDVFQKSTPEEVERFKQFVEKTTPYDCVIDGLNVAFSMGAKKPPHILANLLASVVNYFNQKNKHVLILGRKHMNNWPKDVMQFIRKNSSIFLTNNLTHDDPFLLYATLRSGQMTDFFSRDLMRTHAYLLGAELKTVFRRWQQEHQYSLITRTEGGKIIVKEPIRHLIYVHKVDNHWHLPYKNEYCAKPAETFEVPQQWLCISFQK